MGAMVIRSWPGKVVVVTGAARGLGAALTRVFVARGAVVAQVDRAAAPVTAAGSPHSWHHADVADEGAVQQLASDVIARHGHVDALVNNAGVAVSGPCEHVTTADLRWLMDVNFFGVVHACRAFLPHLRARPEAQVLQVVSSFAWLGCAGKGAYAASKAAVRAYSEALRAELHGSSVGLTLLFPGPLATGLVRNARAADPLQREREAAFVDARAVPIDRVTARALAGMQRNAARVVVGRDYRLLDLAVRLAPAWTLAALARLQRRLPF